MMRRGTCRLCLVPDQELKDSHFLLAALYKIARTPKHKNPNPILLSTKVALQSSKQAKDYMFCGVCEDRFNKGGEAWVARNCWPDETNFPLRTALLNAPASRLSTPGFTIYETAAIPAVDGDKLTYFAASIFWRGGVHDWPLLDPPPIRLKLGPYEEGLRQFLMGGEFPKDTVIITSVSARMDAITSAVTQFPWLRNRDGKQREYKFTVPGITFQMFTGKALVRGLRGMCSARSPQKFVYMSPEMDDINVRTSAELVNRVTAMGELTRH
jgi:hypothetical protein